MVVAASASFGAVPSGVVATWSFSWRSPKLSPKEVRRDSATHRHIVPNCLRMRAIRQHHLDGSGPLLGAPEAGGLAVDVESFHTLSVSRAIRIAVARENGTMGAGDSLLVEHRARHLDRPHLRQTDQAPSIRT